MSTRPADSQFELMRQRRFSPFFWVCFLGTFNDNLLKFAITLLLTYQLSVSWLPPEQVGPLLGALFTVPSLLLSALFGLMADKYPLDRLIRLGKLAELGMMGLAALAVWCRQPVALVACVLLSGIHVTWFATVKYAYLPRHLDSDELVGGNGLMEMGLFTAILTGTLVGGLLVLDPQSLGSPAARQAADLAVPVSILAVAWWGWRLAQRVPVTSAALPSLSLSFNPVTSSWRHVKVAAAQGALPSILGISWMWFFGATYMMLFPALTREVYQAQTGVASALLMWVSLGIGAGALCCERLTHRFGASWVVGLGAVAMAVWGGDIAWVAHELAQSAERRTELWTLMAFVQEPAHARIWLDVWFMAMGVGLFSVPLYARMQALASPDCRARVVAANNVLNALSMVLCAALAGALTEAGLTLGQVLGATVILHVMVCLAAWVKRRHPRG